MLATLGNSPWTVLAEGVAEQTDWNLGAVTIALSFVVLLLWIPLRQRPGLGTVLNAVVVGLAITATLAATSGVLLLNAHGEFSPLTGSVKHRRQCRRST